MQRVDLLKRTAEIKSTASGLGFHRVGITSADPVGEAGRRFSEWLADGFAGEMAYLQKSPEVRSDPKLRFPEAKSVICLALNYYPSASPDPSVPEGSPRGKVARYAWGEDYHTIIEEKLALLISAIEDRGGRCWKGYVDHGPLLERAFAERAGLGFIGKNTTLITPDYGSWVFLAEVVTDLELVEDLPMTSQCGSCRRCLDACPTGALTEAYRLDARRCISYLTIENKKEIPEKFHPQMGGWLFGCDLCQEVCPYNRNPVQTDVERFSPERGAGPSLSLEEIRSIEDNRRFKERFSHTPLVRTKRSGLIRNANAIQVSQGEHD
ncbi:MAG: tRNA epoxyqueuosine(34) reductase QueG [Candidatus Manganitrophus sp.]|nr:MAG: tRNA epoxyqueuosine(34) reductase QueG [Candidatus Manganitrophus sp.]